MSSDGCVLMCSDVCVLMRSDGCVMMCSDVCVLIYSNGCVLMSSDGCVLMCSDVCVLMCSDVCVLMRSYVRYVLMGICGVPMVVISLYIVCAIGLRVSCYESRCSHVVIRSKLCLRNCTTCGVVNYTIYTTVRSIHST